MARDDIKKELTMVLFGLLWLQAGGSTFAQTRARIRMERTPVDGGAELITWFERIPESSATLGKSELPIVSVLNDTLADSEPGESKLRQVWVYTYAPPSIAQRVQGGVPFLYHRIWSDSDHSAKPPRPVFDMGAPSKGLWMRLAMAGVQAEVVNPAGAIERLTTMSYGGNLGEYKKTHVWEALDQLPPADENPADSGLTADEYQLLESRMQLNGRMFSGLVRDDALPGFYEKYQIQRTETRGHNWELLRQAAEDNGLVFEPLTVGGTVNAFAVVAVDRQDLACGVKRQPHRYNSQFLKISDPFTDDRLCHWKGDTEEQDADGRESDRIPLALYSLDYPGIPLLLVDFRRPSRPTRSEMTLRFSDDLAVGVFGFTGYGTLTHLGYQAVKSGWIFIHTRHGSATNRSMRRREFVELRHALGVDSSLDPALRAQLANRLETLDIDPLERTWSQEVRGAWAQYDALMKYAAAPEGMARLIQADREQEARAMAHGLATRSLLDLARLSTFGLYRHHDELSPAVIENKEKSSQKASAKRAPSMPDADQSEMEQHDVAPGRDPGPAISQPVMLPAAASQAVLAAAGE